MDIDEHNEPRRGLELLKSILPLMSRHAAGYHPVSYALWYEYALGHKAPLREDVDEHLRRHARLTGESTQQLYRRHLVGPREQSLYATRLRLAALVERVKGAVVEADKGTGEFDAQLAEFQHELGETESLDDLGGSLGTMRLEAERMNRTVEVFSLELEESQNEVRRLTEEMQRLQADVLTDALSGLLNRRGFDQELAHFALRARERNCTLAIVMLDIDEFKQVNDTYGHALGDRVIAAVGRVIQECVGLQGVAARYGGEEFAVLLPYMTLQAAEAIAQQIRGQVEQGKIRHRADEDPIGSITLSGGVAAWTENDDVGAFVERADRALYDSKRNGRNRITMCSNERSDRRAPR